MKVATAVGLSVITFAAAPLAWADDGDRVGTRLIGYNEVPSISTVGRGQFDARISDDETRIDYRLSYRDMETPVLQAHIHFGQLHTNGGISAFLCANPPIVPPPNTPACPPTSGTVTGTIEAVDVIGPNAQGIEATRIDELIRAIRAGAAYVNVHTTRFMGGEIRGQLDGDHDHHGRSGDDD